MPGTSPFLFFISLNYELHGQLCQNGYYLLENVAHSHNPDPSIQLVALVNQFKNTVYEAIRFFQNQECHYRSITGVTIDPHNGPIAELILETAEGVQQNESLPTYCAAVLSLRTGLGGRSHIGRSYYAGVSEEDSANSKLTPDSLSRLQGIGNELLLRFGTSDSGRFWTYGVWSWKRAMIDGSRNNPNIDLAFTPIVQCLPRIILGTQKHRQIGHGG